MNRPDHVRLFEPHSRLRLRDATAHAGLLRVTARDAGVDHLLYYHIVPPLIAPGQPSPWLDGADDVFPDDTIGVVRVLLSLPAGSEDILHAWRSCVAAGQGWGEGFRIGGDSLSQND